VSSNNQGTTTEPKTLVHHDAAAVPNQFLFTTASNSPNEFVQFDLSGDLRFCMDLYTLSSSSGVPEPYTWKMEGNTGLDSDWVTLDSRTAVSEYSGKTFHPITWECASKKAQFFKSFRVTGTGQSHGHLGVARVELYGRLRGSLTGL
jgi:hypothetical protein